MDATQERAGFHRRRRAESDWVLLLPVHQHRRLGRAQLRVPKTGILKETRIDPFFEMADAGDRLDVYARVNKRIPAEIKWRIVLNVVAEEPLLEG